MRCDADQYRHPQLDTDIETVRGLYADTAVSIRFVTTCHSLELVSQERLAWQDVVFFILKCRFVVFLLLFPSREYGTIDDVDVDLQINVSFLEVSKAGLFHTMTW